MRIDLYTKGVLTVIAVLLAVIAFKQYVSPDAVVQAQGSFAGVLYSGPSTHSFFDPKTGDIWDYNDGSSHPANHVRLTKLGAPMTQIK